MCMDRSCVSAADPSRGRAVLRRARAAVGRARSRSLALAAAAVLCGGLGAQPRDPSPPVEFDADSWSFGPEGVTFVRPHITWGEVRLQADDAFATGLDATSDWTLRGNVRVDAELGVIEADEAEGRFAADEWRFSGNVRINLGTAVLQADDGRFTFAADRVATAELNGSPAVFEDRAPLGPQGEMVPVRGTADRLLYDASAQTLRLADNVTALAGETEYRGCDLAYDFARQAVTAGSSDDCDERVHIRIPVRTGNADPPEP
jgi:lipopolysaccharide transport protein LptA